MGDCELLCTKASDCGELRFFDEFDDVQECVNDCENVSDGQVECWLDCDTELSCSEYEFCIRGC